MRRPRAGTGRRAGCEGIALHHIDLGGGVGIRYRDETPPDLAAYAAFWLNALPAAREAAARAGPLAGRNAGLLLTRVEY